MSLTRQLGHITKDIVGIEQLVKEKKNMKYLFFTVVLECIIKVDSVLRKAMYICIHYYYDHSSKKEDVCECIQLGRDD